MSEPVNLKVIQAQGEQITRSMEGILMAAYNIYNVAKVIPHPYDAIGDMGNSFLHDFRGFAFTVAKYIERVEKELEKTSG